MCIRRVPVVRIAPVSVSTWVACREVAEAFAPSAALPQRRARRTTQRPRLSVRRRFTETHCTRQHQQQRQRQWWATDWTSRRSTECSDRERKCADTVGTVLVHRPGSNFIKQHSETVTVWNCQNADCSLKKNKFIVSLIIINFRHSFVPYRSHRCCYLA